VLVLSGFSNVNQLLSLRKMLALLLLFNIDRVTMVTDFREFNKKYAISRLLYEISPKSLHELKRFQTHTNK